MSVWSSNLSCSSTIDEPTFSKGGESQSKGFGVGGRIEYGSLIRFSFFLQNLKKKKNPLWFCEDRWSWRRFSEAKEFWTYNKFLYMFPLQSFPRLPTVHKLLPPPCAVEISEEQLVKNIKKRNGSLLRKGYHQKIFTKERERKKFQMSNYPTTASWISFSCHLLIFSSFYSPPKI